MAAALGASASSPGAAPRAVADLISGAHWVGGETPIAEVAGLFERFPETDSVAIVDGRRLGIVVRARFFLQLGKRFGYALFEHRPIRLLWEEGSTVEASSDPVEAVTLALEREPGRIYDDLLVVEEGRYLGTLSMRTLMAHHKDVLRASVAELSELDRRNRELGELNRLQSEFMANMTHELRSPVHTMLGVARLLAEDPLLAPSQRGHVDALQRRGQALLGLIDNILDLNRLEAGSLTALYEPVELAPLFEELLQGAELLVLGKPVRLALRLANLPQSFVTDAVLLRRILTNLLANAAKFTEQGAIELNAWAEGRRLLVQVADTGAGIRAADLPRLFTRFTQLEATRTKRHPGSGLGLAIVKGLVEQLQGRILVDSREGVGTTFTLQLPDARSLARA